MSASVYDIAAVVGYLLGSIPFGLILTRIAGLGDVRTIGSGNIGATNVLRTGKKGLAAATLLLDGGKGALACLFFFPESPWLTTPAMIAGFAAIIGHNFPVWLKFRGGKGVATSLGVWLALSWPIGLLACFTWLIAAVLFRFSSLAALIGLSAAPAFAFLFGDSDLVIMGILIALLAIWRHRENIKRLLNGTETKIGHKG